MSYNQEETDTETGPIDRRDFLKRSLGAGVTAAAAVSLAATLRHDGQFEPTSIPRQTTFASYAVTRPANAKRLAIVHGSDDPLDLLAPALKSLGGIESFINKGDVVAIKPNVAFASPPAIGATTNPQLLGQLVRLCLGAGAARVIVTDNPINQPRRCFAQTGIGPAARAAGAEVFIPSGDSSFAAISVEGGRLIRNWPCLHEPLARANKLIGITPIKDHSRAAASMSMKNWYGLLGGRRNQFHQDINNIIKELAMMITPTLVILDGTRVMFHNGPTGGSLSDLARRNTLIAATDQVAADAVGYSLLDRDPTQLSYLQMATDLNLGDLNYKRIPHVEFNI